MVYNIYMDYAEKSLAKHKLLKGKISVSLRDTPDTKEKLSIYYTPGVAAVSTVVAEAVSALTSVEALPHAANAAIAKIANTFLIFLCFLVKN